jgi:hypothetical protein
MYTASPVQSDIISARYFGEEWNRSAPSKQGNGALLPSHAITASIQSSFLKMVLQISVICCKSFRKRKLRPWPKSALVIGLRKEAIAFTVSCGRFVIDILVNKIEEYIL